MSSAEVKLIAVWTGKAPPPSSLKLSDYTLPIAGDMPEGYFNALYGNRAAYSALGEILTAAQNKGLYFSTAVVTVSLNREKKPGVVHLQDLHSNAGGMVNLTRVSKEVTAEIAGLYKSFAMSSATNNDLPDRNEESTELDIDWRKPFRFMPNRLDLVPQVFDLLQCEVLVHPVHLSTSAATGAVHYIASLKLEEVTIMDATPNRFEVGPHPDRIEF